MRRTLCPLLLRPNFNVLRPRCWPGVIVRESRVHSTRAGPAVHGRGRARHAVRLVCLVACAVLVGVVAWVIGVAPVSAAEVCPPPSEGEFCGQLSEPDSESGSSSFSGRWSLDSECSPPASLVQASELPSDALPSWVPLEDGQACVQIVYSIQKASEPVPEPVEPGNEQWQADLMGQIEKFQVTGWLLIFLLAALFMRTKARI